MLLDLFRVFRHPEDALLYIGPIVIGKAPDVSLGLELSGVGDSGSTAKNVTYFSMH